MLSVHSTALQTTPDATLPRKPSPVDHIMDMIPQKHLLAERREAHLWLTLNRADKANALNVALMEGAAAALAAAAVDPAVKAVLLTGAGERVFCAGVDVREQPADGDLAVHRSRRGAALFALINAIVDCPKPVIAVLNGVASGGGAMLALVCDARVAVEASALSLPEVNLGMPTFSGASIVREVGGLALAIDLVQSGRPMPASEALQRGLVNAVMPRSELQAAAIRMAESLGGKDPKAYAANKAWLTRGLKSALDEAREANEAHRRHAS